jgi:hypothetical protein
VSLREMPYLLESRVGAAARFARRVQVGQVPQVHFRGRPPAWVLRRALEMEAAALRTAASGSLRLQWGQVTAAP